MRMDRVMGTWAKYEVGYWAGPEDRHVIFEHGDGLGHEYRDALSDGHKDEENGDGHKD